MFIYLTLMIILEKPFVSETLIRCAMEHGIPVLRNAMSEQLVRKGHALNLYGDEAFAEAIRQGKRLYTMSENALGWIAENLPEAELLKKTGLLKDKAAFRRICSGMYPDFFFREVAIGSLKQQDAEALPYPLVLKPSVGFLSAGVYVVRDAEEYRRAVCDIEAHFREVGRQFPEFVVGTQQYLLEAYIKGEEYAVDVYFDGKGEPVILNIFHHRFADESDTSDRLYCSSRALYDRYEAAFTDFLVETNRVLRLHDFPIHIEFRYDGSRAVPIEINPLRFAGFCLNELQTHISGLHPVAAYLNDIHIGKEEMWKGKENDTYSFLVLERPSDVPENVRFNRERFCRDFSDVLEIREVEDPAAGVSATAFIRTDKAHEEEFHRVLHLDMHDYVTA